MALTLHLYSDLTHIYMAYTVKMRRNYLYVCNIQEEEGVSSYTCVYTLMHTHTHTTSLQPHTHAHTRTREYTRTHTHTKTHARTHAHTHTSHAHHATHIALPTHNAHQIHTHTHIQPQQTYTTPAHYNTNNTAHTHTPHTQPHPKAARSTQSFFSLYIRRNWVPVLLPSHRHRPLLQLGAAGQAAPDEVHHSLTSCVHVIVYNFRPVRSKEKRGRGSQKKWRKRAVEKDCRRQRSRNRYSTCKLTLAPLYRNASQTWTSLF